MVIPDKKNSKVLYLTYDGLTDPLGQSQILPYLRGLSIRGFAITIISFEKRKNFREWNEKIKKDCNDHLIVWIPLTYHKSPPILSTIFDLILLRINAERILRENPVRLIHCRSYITSLVGSALQRKYGVKFIFDMRGFWADERIEGQIWNPKNPVFRIIYKYFKIKERRFLSFSDHVIVLTEKAKSIILNLADKKKNMSILSNKITVIPTCVDTVLFDPERISDEEKKHLRISLGLAEDTRVLLYAGSLGTWYMMGEMLDFFECLNDIIANYVFLILTPEWKYIDNLLKNKGFRRNNRQLNPASNCSWQNPDFIGYISGLDNTSAIKVIVSHTEYSKVPLYLSLASLSICFIRPTFSKSGSSATKLAESIAMKVPVISNSKWGDIDKLISEPRNGYLIQAFMKDEYLRVARKISSIGNEKWQMIDNSALKLFSLDNGIDSYYRIYIQ